MWPVPGQDMVCVYWEVGLRLRSASSTTEAKQEAQLLYPDSEPWFLITAGEVQESYEWWQWPVVTSLLCQEAF